MRSRGCQLLFHSLMLISSSSSWTPACSHRLAVFSWVHCLLTQLGPQVTHCKEGAAQLLVSSPEGECRLQKENFSLSWFRLSNSTWAPSASQQLSKLAHYVHLFSLSDCFKLFPNPSPPSSQHRTCVPDINSLLHVCTAECF